MSRPVLYGSNEPDPGDFSDFYPELQSIEQRIDHSSVTEPFAPDYSGEITARDIAMKQYLGERATDRVFDILALTWQRLGATSLHYNADTARWN